MALALVNYDIIISTRGIGNADMIYKLIVSSIKDNQSKN